MAETCWLNESNILFPLAAGTKLLTDDGDADPDFDAVQEAFAEESIIGLELVEDGRMVSLAGAHNQNEWSSENGVKEILRTLAPVCPDGTYAEFESSYPEADTRLLRIIVSDEGVIEDFPNLSWDDPVALASGQYRGPVEASMNGDQLLDHISRTGLVPIAVQSPEGEIALAFEVDSGDLVIHFAPDENGAQRHLTVGMDDGPFLVWTPTQKKS